MWCYHALLPCRMVHWGVGLLAVCLAVHAAAWQFAASSACAQAAPASKGTAGPSSAAAGAAGPLTTALLAQLAEEVVEARVLEGTFRCGLRTGRNRVAC